MSNVMAHVLVNGHVQGVFFRGYVQRRANALGVTGWVRNLADGQVDVDILERVLLPVPDVQVARGQCVLHDISPDTRYEFGIALFVFRKSYVVFIE